MTDQQVNDAEDARRDAGQTAAARASFAETATRVGAQLAAMRQQRGMSVEDISARLKIPVGKLKALESGHWESLPEMPFIQGVIRSYTRMLGADPLPLIEALRPFGRRVPIDDVPPPSAGGPSIPRSPAQFRSPTASGGSASRWVWLVGVIVVVGASGWWFHSHRESQPAVVTLGGASGPAADVASEPTAQAGTGASAVEGSSAEASGVTAYPAQPPVEASSSAPAQPVVSEAATVAAAPATASSAATPAIAGQQATLHVVLSGDSWIEVRGGDGKVAISRVLKAGDTQDITAVAPLKIVIGNVAGVQTLQLNGAPVELKSRGAGNVARLSLP